MTKRYCDRCGQQIDEGVHAWYVLELHGTDGEFRHKELCEECYELLAEDNYIPRIEQTEPQRDDIGNCNICKYVGLEHRCNQCGYEEELYILNAKPTNFCSNCGAQMSR